jgi:SAM-dependent methyltransferase
MSRDSPYNEVQLPAMKLETQIAKFRSLLLTDASGYTYERLTFRMQQLFGTLPIFERRILEIGAGNGAMSIWLALNGAGHVTALEPEAAGASPGIRTELERRIADIGLTNLTFLPRALDDAPLVPGTFDIILSYNSINHLHETRADLNSSRHDRERFVQIFRGLNRLLTRDGVAIIADCSRNNLFGALGITHPLPGLRPVEWALHQHPRTWISVMREAGFRRFDLHWYVPYALRNIRTLADNALFSWLTISHFTFRAFRE